MVGTTRSASSQLLQDRNALIQHARSTPIEDLIGQYGLKLRGKVERAGPCPHCGGVDRFAINTRKQIFICRGCNAGGDVIALVQFLEGCDFAKAIEILAGETPHVQRQRADSTPKATDVASYEQSQRDKARFLFRSSVPAPGTLTEVYLKARGITILSPAIRFLAPRKPGQHAAMVVPFGIPDEIEIQPKQIVAVQLTLLKPDGSGKPDIKPNKITIGSPAGMPMVIAPLNDLLGLAITEGVEDALSAHAATGLGAWASGGAGFMPKLVVAIDAMPTLPECATIFAHEDEDGQRRARDLADLLLVRGIEVLMEGLK